MFLMLLKQDYFPDNPTSLPTQTLHVWHADLALHFRLILLQPRQVVPVSFEFPSHNSHPLLAVTFKASVTSFTLVQDDIFLTAITV